MWDETKRQRFQDLRQREAAASLTEAEQAELTSLIAEVDAAEAAYLEPATQRLRQARQAIEDQNRRVESLARRKEGLAERLRHVLADAEAEREAISRELVAVLGAQESDTSE